MWRKGTNHGRKYYQKLEKTEGQPTTQILIYYWDQREGADFSGWWFGDEIGGSSLLFFRRLRISSQQAVLETRQQGDWLHLETRG